MRRRPWRDAPQKPYVARNAAATSAIMSRIRGTNNKAELLLRKELWRRGYRYRLYAKGLPGTPDLVFASSRVLVYVDGDFWHGRALMEGGESALRHVFRTERQDYWVARIKKNVGRDRRTTKSARKLGWKVIRLWERDILLDLSGAANFVERTIVAAMKRR
jgi:DNA mismatch endonuclease, patch repair protein